MTEHNPKSGHWRRCGDARVAAAALVVVVTAALQGVAHAQTAPTTQPVPSAAPAAQPALANPPAPPPGTPPAQPAGPPAPAATAAPLAGAAAGPPSSPPSSTSLALPPQPPPPGADKRGFLNDFSAWWDKSISDFNAKIKEQQSKLDEYNKQQNAAAKDAAAATGEAMKSAADAMVRLPASRVIEIHEVCAVAGNGAPDCGPVVLNACRAKGFAGGQPVDIRTAEKCTASLWVSGEPQATGDCPVETVVLRAACQ